jgi:hypothetical protein
MKGLCVFCGSRAGVSPAHLAAARAVGAAVARRGWPLVYGGASVGLMGTLADAALAAGGRVLGVLPRFLADREIAHRGLTELRQVDTMHARKLAMADASDAFLALPGGVGTLEEIFEAVTWMHLGLQPAPCAFLSVEGYYDELARFLDAMVAQGFMEPALRARITFHAGVDEALDALARAALRPAR